MKRPLIMLIAAVMPAAAVILPVASSAAADNSPATTTCAPVPVAAPTGTKVVSVDAVARPGGDFTFPNAYPPADPITDVPAWCDVRIVVTHPGANDTVTIKVSLPQDAKNWNGRFQATGGSGYSAGDISDLSIPLIGAVKKGYVGAATDAGVKDGLDASWGLTADGRTNTGLLTNFASRSVHDLAVIGKDVTAKFYQRAASYSYFTGCSTGGRQGYAEAEYHPTDFQGILANAPAVDWNRFEIATLWSQAVFNEEHVAPTKCELDAFTSAAVAACDTLDGVKDGVIDNPATCTWDARRLIGTKVLCDGKELTISKALAVAVDKLWAGPVTPWGKKLWYGQNKGSSFDFIAAYNKPFTVPDQWAKYFVTKNPSFDSTKLTYATFERVFASATTQYDAVIADNNPNLSKFAKAGGKLLTWHGQSDQLIPTLGTVHYRRQVDALFGGTKRVDDFYRLFLLPGVDHCGTKLYSTGPLVKPGADLDALVNWVEKGDAPATLPVTSPDGTTTQDICRYPMLTQDSHCGTR
ncbi:feruloyl esterase [Kribbella voronezhensis]|uniref:Feruloyl esterase n=1 Tax=Kribbella voronezhensis TaxID=2512212 RepID=A0A4R7SZ93_9ACTN|nr:tannase/feruloyl esterase family alpha/beta hydrolase [Kribbella voronezhensis]TDU83867.1 feruloyl esterase [Kribbella voronezhensis]